ncbi:hypothetical protein VP01_1097g1 [Puccinia sorghi]|uniref:Uncharacterized protein n=1 Tax=Puccinia sorghi TaxID=27349 RepID=A0A0L6VSZ1_9BASI|nr:hypothetical protein VP01_1097g1 [Puccinia sorghi]
MHATSFYFPHDQKQELLYLEADHFLRYSSRSRCVNQAALVNQISAVSDSSTPWWQYLRMRQDENRIIFIMFPAFQKYQSLYNIYYYMGCVGWGGLGWTLDTGGGAGWSCCRIPSTRWQAKREIRPAWDGTLNSSQRMKKTRKQYYYLVRLRQCRIADPLRLPPQLLLTVLPPPCLPLLSLGCPLDPPQLQPDSNWEILNIIFPIFRCRNSHACSTFCTTSPSLQASPPSDPLLTFSLYPDQQSVVCLFVFFLLIHLPSSSELARPTNDQHLNGFLPRSYFSLCYSFPIFFLFFQKSFPDVFLSLSSTFVSRYPSYSLLTSFCTTLCLCYTIQIRFFITVLQQMARNDPMISMLSPALNPPCWSPSLFLALRSQS